MGNFAQLYKAHYKKHQKTEKEEDKKVLLTGEIPTQIK
jgi:hypothetical protein